MNNYPNGLKLTEHSCTLPKNINYISIIFLTFSINKTNWNLWFFGYFGLIFLKKIPIEIFCDSVKNKTQANFTAFEKSLTFF